MELDTIQAFLPIAMAILNKGMETSAAKKDALSNLGNKEGFQKKKTSPMGIGNEITSAKSDMGVTDGST